MKLRTKKKKNKRNIKNSIVAKEIINELNDSTNEIELFRNENIKLKGLLKLANLKYRVSINNEKKLKKIINNLEEEKKYILQQYKDDLYEIERSIYEFKNNYKNQLQEIEEIKKSYEVINSKYYALKNSKLGKLTLKYWEFRKGGK